MIRLRAFANLILTRRKVYESNFLVFLLGSLSEIIRQSPRFKQRSLGMSSHKFFPILITWLHLFLSLQDLVHSLHHPEHHQRIPHFLLRFPRKSAWDVLLLGASAASPQLDKRANPRARYSRRCESELWTLQMGLREARRPELSASENLSAG